MAGADVNDDVRSLVGRLVSNANAITNDHHHNVVGFTEARIVQQAMTSTFYTALATPATQWWQSGI